MYRPVITGVPGAGKTCLGRYLATDHGFEHLDFEEHGVVEAHLEPDDSLLRERLQAGTSLAITWGFVPHVQIVPHVVAIRDLGFEWLWLDDGGIRSASRRAYFRRERERGNSNAPADYAKQMRKINRDLDLDGLAPRRLNPFTAAGEFRPAEDIFEEMIAAPTDPV